jgi:hypothetical protein
MTVLLIDASGHKRVYEIRHWMPRIYVPIPQRFVPVYDVTPAYEPPWIATFEYSDELSYPPVYRQKLP